MSPIDQLTGDRCFPADEIRSLFLGRGTGKAIDRLTNHLAACSSCASLADTICLDSALVCSLRGDDLPPLPSERELDDVVARISRIDRSSRAGRAITTRPEVNLPGQFGPYRLVELLGVGGMGVVYRAEDTALNRFVAVKVVKGGADADTRARFLSEARALAAVRHDTVVTVYCVGEEPTAEGAIPYLAMELLEGQSLRDWMAGAPRPSIEWVVQAGRQIAAGLAFVHDAGMVHRDIKPANLWLEAPQGWTSQSPETRLPLASVGRVKLLDFGLAHPPGEMTEASAAGTLAYMAPEQARGEAVDARADLFGFGCVLYELYTGRLPFPERGRRWSGWDVSPAPIRSPNPAVPERLADLIERLLAADRADRPSSARAVELELASFDARSAGTATVSGQEDVTVVVRPGERPKRRRLLVMVAALMVVTTTTATIVLTNHLSPTSDPNPISDSSPASDLSPVSDSPGNRSASQKTNEPLQPTDPLGNLLGSSRRVDDKWCRDVAALPPQQQLNAVGPMLAKLNPGYDWSHATGWVEPRGVYRYTINTDKVSDLSPLQALRALRVLRCQGSAPGLGLVTDLSPLSRLRLIRLFCANNPGIRDVSPIQLDRLDYLDVSHTGLKTLAGLAEAPLTNLNIAGTQISNLEPIRRMSKLQVLDCTDCPVTDFEPLTAVPLRELHADVRADRDKAVLARIKTLEKINGVPVKEFWKRLSASTPK